MLVVGVVRSLRRERHASAASGGLGSGELEKGGGAFMNAADTAWMMVSTALVLLMTPALGFFYGGLVRSKNALNTLMMSIASLGFVGIAWALAGYSLAFAPGIPVIGGLSHIALRGVGLEAQ